MKKIFLCAVFIAASFTSIAQMGIGTTTSKGALDIESSTYGLVMPRVAHTGVVENPNGGEVVNGTMVYDELNKCVAVYVDGIWGCIQFIPEVPVASTAQLSGGSGVTLTFVSHNLGADISLDPHEPVVGLQGGYVQWGKKGPDIWYRAPNDGSKGFAAAPTSTNSNSDPINGWSNSITVGDTWPTDTDPCPTGYRVPTVLEWEAVKEHNSLSTTGTFTDSDTGYGSAVHFGPDANTKLLTLPVAGYRYSQNGGLYNRGEAGYYWSSDKYHLTSYGPNWASYFHIDDNGQQIEIKPELRLLGLSVRCIKG